ncbi:MAG TPA: hypothetical protein VMZ74_01385 [Ramlibacter sp.]|nr:hypothetical protein [Ramlibacter sp.]
MTADKSKLTDLRATAPAALEDMTEQAWADFQALQKAGQRQFEATRPSSDVAPLQPSSASEKPAAAKPKVTLDAALALSRKGNRVCPMPDQWKELSELLQQAAPQGTVAPFPIDGEAWNIVPAMQKRMRLREQLEWADRYNLVEAVFTFLEKLPEDSWLHF